MISKDILIIDDEDFIRDLLNDFLSLEGFTPQTAASADMAYEILSSCQKPFDLILLDRHLDNSRAEDFIQRINSLPHCTTSPIILLTGDHEVGNEDARQMGAQGVIHKPFQIDSLLKSIEKILEKS